MQDSVETPEEKLKKTFVELTVLALKANVNNTDAWPAILIDFHNLMNTVKNN